MSSLPLLDARAHEAICSISQKVIDDILGNIDSNQMNFEKSIYEKMSSIDKFFTIIKSNIKQYSTIYPKIESVCKSSLKTNFKIQDKDAIDFLVGDFQKKIEELDKMLNFPESFTDSEAPERNGFLKWDSIYYDVCLDILKEDRDGYHVDIKEKISVLKQDFKRDKFDIIKLLDELWIPKEKYDNHPKFAFNIARWLWSEKASKRWERKKTNKPAISLPVNQKIFDTCWNPNNKIKEIDSAKYIMSSTGNRIATITEKTLLTLEEIQKRHSLLNTLLGHKLFRFLVKEYQLKFFNTNDREPGSINIEGGREKLAELLDLKSKEDVTKIPDILKAGQEFSIELPGLSIGGLWTFIETKGVGRANKSHISITLGAALRPHYMYNFKKDNQILIPIVSIPTLVNPKNYHGQQAAAQFSVVQHIVNDRKFLRQYGGGLFNKQILEKIAHQTCLPQSVMNRAWDAWQRNTEQCEAFLEKIGTDVYQIAKNSTFKEARECIDYLVEQSKIGSDIANKSMDKKKRAHHSIQA